MREPEIRMFCLPIQYNYPSFVYGRMIWTDFSEQLEMSLKSGLPCAKIIPYQPICSMWVNVTFNDGKRRQDTKLAWKNWVHIIFSYKSSQSTFSLQKTSLLHLFEVEVLKAFWRFCGMERKIFKWLLNSLIIIICKNCLSNPYLTLIYWKISQN